MYVYVYVNKSESEQLNTYVEMLRCAQLSILFKVPKVYCVNRNASPKLFVFFVGVCERSKLTIVYVCRHQYIRFFCVWCGFFVIITDACWCCYGCRFVCSPQAKATSGSIIVHTDRFFCDCHGLRDSKEKHRKITMNQRMNWCLYAHAQCVFWEEKNS